MRVPRSLLAMALVLQVGTLHAQARPLPVVQSATLDVSAAFQEHWRVALEALVFGRFSVGLTGEYTTQPDLPIDGIAYPVEGDPCPITTLCTRAASDPSSRYRAWSFNLSGRWYPAVLSVGGPRQSVGLYLGEFVGYHERRIGQPIYYGCPTCMVPQDSITQTFPRPGPAPQYTQILHGIEPGFELGVRMIPMRHAVIDVGARFRFETIQNDFTARTQGGGVDSRLVVAVGLGW